MSLGNAVARIGQGPWDDRLSAWAWLRESAQTDRLRQALLSRREAFERFGASVVAPIVAALEASERDLVEVALLDGPEAVFEASERLRHVPRALDEIASRDLAALEPLAVRAGERVTDDGALCSEVRDVVRAGIGQSLVGCALSQGEAALAAHDRAQADPRNGYHRRVSVAVAQVSSITGEALADAALVLDADGVAPLVALARGDNVRLVRAAIGLLGHVVSDAVDEVLVSLLDHADGSVRSSATHALEGRSHLDLADLMIERLSDRAALPATVDFLSRTGEQGAAQSAAKLLDDDADSERQALGCDLLADLGVGSADGRIRRLAGAQDPAVRSAAIRAYSSARAPDGIGVAEAALDDECYSVRLSAVAALGSYTSNAALSGLVRALEDDVPPVVLNAVLGLGDLLPNPDAVKALIRVILRDPHHLQHVANGLLAESGVPEEVRMEPYRACYRRRRREWGGVVANAWHVLRLLDVADEPRRPQDDEAALEFSRELLSGPTAQLGFRAMCAAGKEDATLEFNALKPKFDLLFGAAQRRAAARRLIGAGVMHFPPIPWSDRGC